MDDLLADRFLPSGSGWLDLASGTSVQIRLAAAGAREQQLVWSERCAVLARLRHPLLNALVDYGAADASRLFEAYEVRAPLRTSGNPAVRLLRHGTRFLKAHGLPVAATLAPAVFRAIESSTSPRIRRAAGSTAATTVRGRPLGIVLQPRAVLDAVADTLREAAPGGVTTVAIHGGRGSGLRTTALLAARVARLLGYVPLSASVLQRRPWLATALSERHVALLLDGSAGALDRAARAHVARFITTLGAASARRHVVIAFGREPMPGPALHMDVMGATAMHAMVYTDRQYGPSVEELLSHVGAADGRPGALVERLRGSAFEAGIARFAVARESSAVYATVREAGVREAPGRGRLSHAVHRAPERADRLAAAGRHAVAGRVLARAARVLEGRAEPAAAARCALHWGWILRARGRDHAALAQFERGRALAGESVASAAAATAIGVAWTDAGRLIEAEALLRSAESAARLMDDAAALRAATMALARCVLWQERPLDAAAILRAVLGSDTTGEAWTLAARVEAAGGEIARAAAAASNALERAAAGADARLLAAACRAALLVRTALGDSAGAREMAERGLRAATAAHLPLAALRIRAAWLQALRGSDPLGEHRRLRARLQTALARPLSSLVRRQIEAACTEATAAPAAVGGHGFAHLEEWLELAQVAPDDHTALQRLADTLATRLGAATVVVVSSHAHESVVVRSGKSWSGDTGIALRALATGAAVFTDATLCECAAPIRFGADTIGAIGCRWTAGRAVDPHSAGALCAAAALAAAPALRALADSAPPPQPDAMWQDLLGTSPSAAVLRGAILNASRAPFPVLIQGESGSGKELVARAIHRLGPRRHRRLCTINCAAISDELLEAELFGHTRGAFTGAVTERAGLFEEADGGTLFLDEVGELSSRAQAKLLRVLQDGEVRRVGENLARRVDTRVVAATNRRLEQEVEAGRFRADLRFRLDVIRIAVPALRDRATDIPALVAHFWKDVAAQVGSRATLAPETVAALTRYQWPGNVRELQNTVASLAVHGPRRGRITPGTLPVAVAPASAAAPASFEAAREDFERRFVQAALAEAGGHRSRAARALGVSRQGLAKMLRRLQLDTGEDLSV